MQGAQGTLTQGAQGAGPFPRVVLIHMGSPEEGKTFLDERWPGAIAISDPDRTLFRAFDLGRASLGQVFGLRVWKEALKVARFGVGKPVGDPLALGGTFLLQGSHLLASDIATHAGHVPDYDGMAKLARTRVHPNTESPTP